MGHEVFEWVIAIAVLVVFISNLIFLWLIYSKLKPLTDKLQATSDRLGPILNEAQGIMSNAKDVVAAITPIVSEAQPVVRNIMTKTNDITDMVHAQATEIRTLMHDMVLTVGNQVERLGNLVRRTTDGIEGIIKTIERQATEPVREVNYLIVAIRGALSVLFDRDKKRVNQVYRDKEVISMAEYEEFQAPGSKTKTGVLKDKLEDGAQKVKEKVRRGFDQTREGGKRAVETIGHQIEEKPLISLLFAFGAGFFLGRLLSGVRREGPLS